MQFVGKVISSVSEFYRDINPSTLSGAIDVIVVEDVESGELACSPFHVRFGKLQLLRPQEKAVELRINGGAVDRDLMMKVGEAGETFFVLSREELGGAGGADLPSEYLTSPLIGPETPVPLEQIEEFKLSSGGTKKDNVNMSDSSIATNNTTVNSSADNAAKNASISGMDGLLNVPNGPSNVKSPEWKWEWGDLPMKKNQPVEEESIINREVNNAVDTINTGDTVNTSNNVNNGDTFNTIDTLNTIDTVNTGDAVNTGDTVNIHNTQNIHNTHGTINTVELYEYLCGREYLEKCYEEGGFTRFPPRSMICRIYRLDRGLHFRSPTEWPQELPALLNESVRLIESDFLLNPNVVIEESSRLVYQFSWENRRVSLSGSVGAAVVFYAQTYARILPLEIVKKLAEIAALRLAKRKFSKSKAGEENEEGVVNGDEAGGVVVNNMRENGGVVELNESIQEEKIEILKGDGKKINTSSSNNKSTTNSHSWRSWWSRSTTTSNSVGSSVNNSDQPQHQSQSQHQPQSQHSPSKLSVPEFSGSGRASPMGSPKLVNKLEQLVVSAPPATLSSIVNDSGDVDKSPTKRIIQRTMNLNDNARDNNMKDDDDVSSKCSSKSTLLPLSSESPSTLPLPLSSTSQRSSSPSLSTCSSSNHLQYIKSLRLPSHLLKRLNLKPGVNTITYTVNTRLQGTATCQSRIFLWRSDARVVISDIDGTITKSDALGHLFTMVGKDWTHVGVAQLYSKIAGNGYEFLYLTSRAIGQAASTRGYLKAVEQDRLQLPDGPVIMSPDRLFTALHREVIQRRPDEFKIACLRDIQKLFVPDEEEVSMMGSGMISSSEDEYGSLLNRKKSGVDYKSDGKRSDYKGDGKSDGKSDGNNRSDNDNDDKRRTIALSNSKSLLLESKTGSKSSAHALNPFYAGFGNRPTDTKSYKAVGISASRIFLINPAGDLKLDKLTFYTPYSASSYLKLTEEVDKVFPPVRSPSSLVRVAGDEAFTDFQYWQGQGGSVRMDLVQEAIGSLKTHKDKDKDSYKKNIINTGVGTSVNVLVDEKGKPVSPVTLQMSLDEGKQFYMLKPNNDALSVKSGEKSGEEADSEAENEGGSDNDNESDDNDNDNNDSDDGDDSGEEVLESIDSFPFI